MKLKNLLKIKNITIENKAALAPMAGVTDRAFREICAMLGAGYFTSEMISAKGLIYNSEKTYGLIEHSNIEKPFAIQLFGNCPEDFLKSIVLLKEKNMIPDVIDINMGCPAKKIVKENSGSALMKNPKLCGEIVKAAKTVSSVPITVKIRAGWNDKNKNAKEVAIICEENGADAITVHGRTKEQGYSGLSDLEIIKEVKQNTGIPIIGNGDITCAEKAKKMLEETGCDMVAIGRGAMGNPWIFKEIEYLYKNKVYTPPTPHEKQFIITEHIKKLCSYKGEERGIKEARKHLASYIKNIPGASELRSKAFSAKSQSELIEICRQIT